MRNLLCILLLSPLCSCLSGRAAVSAFEPESLKLYDQRVAREDALKAELPLLEQAVADAVASPDPADDLPAAEALAAANAELQAIEAELAPLEERVNRRQVQPVAEGARAIHPALYALFMAAVPLLGKRGRKLYASALRNASRGKLLVVAGDILKVLGANHSGLQQPPQPPVQPPATGA